MNTLIKFFMTISPLMLLQQKANAQYDYRGDFKVRLDEQQTISAAELANEISVEQVVQRMLKYNNIYGDSKSKIQIQKNSGSVDLNCFNCLIQRVGPESYAHSPDNKEIFVP